MDKSAMDKFAKFAARDMALLTSTITLWALVGRYSAGSGLMADFTGVTLGVLAGACAWVAHEWGHLLAGSFAGAEMKAPRTLKSVYLFGFDNKINDRRQFIIMALGGFAATGLVFLLVVFALPGEWLATRIVRGLVLLEIAVTVALEVPGLLVGIFAYEKLPSVDVLGE